jgi:thioredoxin-like negative regulator of GroEL
MRRNGLFFIILAIVGVAVVLPRLRGVAPTPSVFEAGWTLADAKEASAAQGKPVFAFLTADWCPACQQLKRGAMSDSSVAALISQRTIPVYLNVDESAEDASSFANVSAIPTVILEYDGRELGRSVGSKSARDFRAWLEEALARVDTVEAPAEGDASAAVKPTD